MDDKQSKRLKTEIQRTPATMPVFVSSHILILAGSTFPDGENEKTGDWVVPGSWVYIDARLMTRLVYQHQNVKSCLSGHIHLLDRVEYDGVIYVCDGAVSGARWDYLRRNSSKSS